MSNRFVFFDCNKENEMSFKIPESYLNQLVDQGILILQDKLLIQQKWLYYKKNVIRTRIRKTSRFGTPPFVFYEHTTKYVVNDVLTYEVNNDITAQEFEYMSSMYKDKKMEIKIRHIFTDKDDAYKDYYITADIKTDNPSVCYIEFEAKIPDATSKIQIPEWLKRYEA